MAQRHLLAEEERRQLFGVPEGADPLIRHLFHAGAIVADGRI
jgi:hypothetical protein